MSYIAPEDLPDYYTLNDFFEENQAEDAYVLSFDPEIVSERHSIRDDVVFATIIDWLHDQDITDYDARELEWDTSHHCSAAAVFFFKSKVELGRTKHRWG